MKLTNEDKEEFMTLIKGFGGVIVVWFAIVILCG